MVLVLHLALRVSRSKEYFFTDTYLDCTFADMDKSCDKTIILNGDKFPGTFFSFCSGSYGQNLNCNLTIKAPTSNQRIIVVVDKMDVACGGDKLLVYDGKADQASILDKEQSQQCGTSKYYLRVN